MPTLSPNTFTLLKNTLQSPDAQRVIDAKLTGPFLPDAQEHAEAWLEKVLLLSDSSGRAALHAIRSQLYREDREAFDHAGNQFERAVFLSVNNPLLFEFAVAARVTGGYRQNIQSSLFKTAKHRRIVNDTDSIKRFKVKVAKLLSCNERELIVDYDVLNNYSSCRFQCVLYYNRPMESFHYVDEYALQTQEVVWASSMTILYCPDAGLIDVMTKNLSLRKQLAQIFSQHLLRPKFLKNSVSLVRYKYDHFVEPQALDISEENVVWARITEMAFYHRGRTFNFSVSSMDPEGIYAAISEYVSAVVNKGFEISKIKFTILIRADSRCGDREVDIVLNSKYGCVMNAEFMNDRLLCYRLLNKWCIV